MRNFPWLITCIAIISITACNTKMQTTRKYADLLRGNVKGDIESIQDSTFVVDSSGNIKPDSIVYSLQEYHDGFASKYKEMDSSGKHTSNSTYSIYESGLLKGIQSETNGKTVYKLDVQLDSGGLYTSAQSYDTSGKLDYFNTDLKQNERGLLTGGKLFKADSSLVMSFVTTYEGENVTGNTNYDSAGKVTSRSSYTLNDKGDQVVDSNITYTKDTSVSKVKKFSYIYDASGNWTEKTEMNQMDKPVKITRRKIVYLKK